MKISNFIFKICFTRVNFNGIITVKPVQCTLYIRLCKISFMTNWITFHCSHIVQQLQVVVLSLLLFNKCFEFASFKDTQACRPEIFWTVTVLTTFWPMETSPKLSTVWPKSDKTINWGWMIGQCTSKNTVFSTLHVSRRKKQIFPRPSRKIHATSA